MVDISFEDNAIWYMLIVAMPFIVHGVKVAIEYCKEFLQDLIAKTE